MEECSICMEVYKCPKILPCRHTFCAICLKDYADEMQSRHEMCCPLCRKVFSIPEGDIDNLLSNYFAIERTRKDANQCEVCKVISKARECSKCERIVCDKCATLHKCGHTGNSLTGGVDIDEIENENDDARTHIPYEMSLYFGPIPTIYRAKLISSFSVGINQLSDSGAINGLYPISDTEVWTIPFSGPNIVLFDIFGTAKKIIYVGMGLIDIFVSPDGLISVLQSQTNSILRYRKERRAWEQFLAFGDDIAQEMSVFPDGRVAVVTIDEKNNTSRGTVMAKSHIFIYSDGGVLLSKIEYKQSEFHPFAVTVNPLLNCVCVADTRNAYVAYILSDGNMINQFKMRQNDATSLLQSDRQSCFKPNGICCTSDGYVVIADGALRHLYVLNFSGELVGVVTSYNREDLGIPFVVGVSKGGVLWIGDSNDGRIRTLKIVEFC